MSDGKTGKWRILLYLLIPALAIATLLAILPVPVPHRANPEKDSAGLDSARRAGFLACLDESNGDEQVCLEKMGLLAWYPRDETECVAVAARIDAVLAVEGLPRWPTLYRNERCARMGMSHHEEAAVAGTAEFDDRSYVDCYKIDYMAPNVCDDIHGRHRWSGGSDKECKAIGDIAFKSLLWEMLFENERCWRLGQPHREPG